MRSLLHKHCDKHEIPSLAHLHVTHFGVLHLHVWRNSATLKVETLDSQFGTNISSFKTCPRTDGSGTDTLWRHSTHSNPAVWAALNECIVTESELSAIFFKSFEVDCMNWCFLISLRLRFSISFTFQSRLFLLEILVYSCRLN